MRVEAGTIMDFLPVSVFLTFTVSWLRHWWTDTVCLWSTGSQLHNFSEKVCCTSNSMLCVKLFLSLKSVLITHLRPTSTSPAPSSLLLSIYVKHLIMIWGHAGTCCSLILFLEICLYVSTAKGRSPSLCALIQPLWHLDGNQIQAQ